MKLNYFHLVQLLHSFMVAMVTVFPYLQGKPAIPTLQTRCLRAGFHQQDKNFHNFSRWENFIYTKEWGKELQKQ